MVALHIFFLFVNIVHKHVYVHTPSALQGWFSQVKHQLSTFQTTHFLFVPWNVSIQTDSLARDIVYEWIFLRTMQYHWHLHQTKSISPPTQRNTTSKLSNLEDRILRYLPQFETMTKGVGTAMRPRELTSYYIRIVRCAGSSWATCVRFLMRHPRIGCPHSSLMQYKRLRVFSTHYHNDEVASRQRNDIALLLPTRVQ